MGHPKDNEVYPPGTIVRIKKTGEFARIKVAAFSHNTGGGFLHYMADIEGRVNFEDQYSGWAIYHDDVDLELLPE